MENVKEFSLVLPMLRRELSLYLQKEKESRGDSENRKKFIFILGNCSILLCQTDFDDNMDSKGNLSALKEFLEEFRSAWGVLLKESKVKDEE